MDIDQYIYVQSVAKSVHTKLVNLIGPDSTEASIVDTAVKLLKEAGITPFNEGLRSTVTRF